MYAFLHSLHLVCGSLHSYLHFLADLHFTLRGGQGEIWFRWASEILHLGYMDVNLDNSE